MTGHYTSGRSEVIALLCLRKDIRDIVSLVAPGIHINRREENTKGGVQHDPAAGNVVRDSSARCEPELVGVVQTIWVALLSADENERHTVFEHEIGVRETNVFQRTHEFIPQSDLDCRVVSHLEAVLNKRIGIPLA